MAFDPATFTPVEEPAAKQGFVPVDGPPDAPQPPAKAVSSQNLPQYAQRTSAVDFPALFSGKSTPEMDAAFAKSDSFAANPKQARDRIISQMFVQSSMPMMSQDYVQGNWETVKRTFAKEVLGVTPSKDYSDSALYGGIAELLAVKQEPNPIKELMEAGPDLSITQVHLPEGEQPEGLQPAMFGGPVMPFTPAMAAKVWNLGPRQAVEGSFTPENLALMAAGGVAEGVAKGGLQAAKAIAFGIKGYFASQTAATAIQKAPEVKAIMEDPTKSFSEKATALNLELMNVATAGLLGVGLGFDMVEPSMLKQIAAETKGKTPTEAAKVIASKAEETKIPEQKAAFMDGAEAVSKIPERQPSGPTVAMEAPKEPSVTEPVPAAEIKIEAEPAHVTEQAKEPIKTEGIKNALLTDEEYEQGRGESKSNQNAVDEAQAMVEKDPQAGAKLVDGILDGSRKVESATDNALLLIEKTRIANERTSAEAARNEALQANDLDALAEADIRVAKARDDYQRHKMATAAAGTPAGQILQSRQMLMAPDYSLASMEATLAGTNKDGVLTPEQEKLVKDIHERLEETGDKVKKKTSGQNLLKGRLEKQIAQLDDEIKARKLKPSSKTKTVPDERNQKLIEVRDALKQKHDELFGDEDRPVTDAQKIQRVISIRDRQIEQLEQQIKDRAPFSGGEKPGITSPEIEAQQAKIDALKEEREYLRDSLQPGKDPPTDLEKRGKALDNRIAAIEKQLKDEAPFSKGNKAAPESPELAAKEQTLEALKEQRQHLRDRLQPKPEPKTAQEKWLAATKTRTTKATQAMLDKLKTEDFGYKEKVKPDYKADPELEKILADHERVKQEFDDAVEKYRAKNKPTIEKTMDGAVKWRRAFVLSGPRTVAKLTAAAVFRVGQLTAEEGVKAGISKIPGISKVAQGAPREGGFNGQALARAYAAMFSNMMRDAAQTLKTGKGDIDVLYGDKKDTAIGENSTVGPEVTQMFGNLHAALKAPVKRFAFTLSLEKRMQYAIDHGVDVSNPAVQTANAVLAYKDANAAVFLQDNVSNDMWKSGVGAGERIDPKTGKSKSLAGKGLATGARLSVPITKVPVNVFAETVEHATGLATGSVRLALAARRGVETLNESQRELIMRELTKGTLGAGGLALLIGFFQGENAPIKLGGFYKPGVKAKPGDVPPGGARVFGVDVPPYLMDNPFMMNLQLGQSIYDAMNSKLRKGDKETAGLGTGLWAGLLGLVDETSYGQEVSNVGHILAGAPSERQYYSGELAKGLLVPQAVNFAATALDKDDKGQPIKRKPTTVLEHVESGIPGLRENLPERKPAKSRRKKFEPVEAAP